MLLLQEIKKIVKSIPYLIFVAAIIIGLFSQGVLSLNADGIICSAISSCINP